MLTCWNNDTFIYNLNLFLIFFPPLISVQTIFFNIYFPRSQNIIWVKLNKFAVFLSLTIIFSTILIIIIIIIILCNFFIYIYVCVYIN
jgi:hypothetical protein